MNSRTDDKVTEISQRDYENYYSVILFEISALKKLIDDKSVLLNNEFLKGYYRHLLLKKLYFDEYCFKGNRPAESRRINTLAELKKLDGVSLQETSANISIIEAIRAWLNTINDFRLGNMLWTRIGLESTGSFPLIAKTDCPNAYFGVFAYLLNVFITILQAISHASSSLNEGNIEIGDYTVESKEKIKTSGLRFLEMHKYKFTNDFMWAPINAFYFFNVKFDTCRNFPIIGDTLCVALFFIDILISLYQQHETEQKFINLQLNFIENIVSEGVFGELEETDLDEVETLTKSPEVDLDEYVVKNHLIKKGFAVTVVDKLWDQITKHKNKIQNIANLEKNPMYQALEALEEQKKNADWEHQKNIYLSMIIASAMSSLILSDIFSHLNINFLLIGSIFAIIAKLTLITYNYYEKTEGQIDPQMLSFHRQQLLCQITQQLIYLGVSLLVSFFIVPLLKDNSSSWVYWALSALCVLAAYTIAALLQNTIDKPPPNKEAPGETALDDEGEYNENSEETNPFLNKKGTAV